MVSVVEEEEEGSRSPAVAAANMVPRKLMRVDELELFGETGR